MRPRRAPTLTNPNIVIRLAEGDEEIRIADSLVFRNYVDLGYWQDNERDLAQNRYLHLPTRRVFVVVDGSRIVGTVSTILDSAHGIPADVFQPAIVAQLRQSADTIAEISAFAFAKDYPHQHNLLHFLMAFITRYSFYYSGVDLFVAVCTPKHARFYEAHYGFRRLETAALYTYVKVKAQMLVLNLREAFEATVSPRAGEPGAEFSRFLYHDEHPNLKFPVSKQDRPVWAATA